MPVGTATVTAKTGPGLTVTSGVYTGISQVTFDFVNQVLTITQGTTSTAFDISANNTSTLTYSSAAGLYTLTIS